ncbi:ATP-dependent DNA helicase [Rhizoclosmatium globosum]|uniref:ATP-dependent DNA helicase n=1 Tax=Rhizoclosmatium globosum TaxID=329046 RepID=A0A1Y2BU73_9FUNG|nr:ATP-dependent DNA helicase [Rhizoclosmatium globosum]|eukprot:ORY38320.1 ATP-dependent DNA helicase [Rhizoclosmatium globosum]
MESKKGKGRGGGGTGKKAKERGLQSVAAFFGGGGGSGGSGVNTGSGERVNPNRAALVFEAPVSTSSKAPLAGLELTEEAIQSALTRVFKLAAFRGDQKKIVSLAVKGRNLLVIMPTGAGKSLTYQLPSVLSQGVSIVISPLLALIQNQVDALRALGINAATLNSALKESDRKLVYKDLSEPVPKIKMLYVTPELMATERFREILKFLDLRGMLARLVIDEAHCISEWGHDFRSDYRKLSYFKLAFPKIPIMALTATATESVRQDILKQLDIEADHLLFISSFNRPNLDYQVRYHTSSDRYEDMKETIRLQNLESMRLYGKPRACGIIYCGTRESCESLASRLQSDGIRASAYHAGLSNPMRTAILAAWTHSTTEVVAKKRGASADTPEETVTCDVVIATVAFGMGIDKADVRFVLHWDLAQSMEAYYQQAGRAGRDGLKSSCILYYSREDKDRIIFLISKSENELQQKGFKNAQMAGGGGKESSKNAMKAFEDFIKYCENRKQCRHLAIMDYFGEDSSRLSAQEKLAICEGKSMCDVCRDPKKVEEQWIGKFSAGGGIGRRRDLEESMRLPDGTWVNFAGNNKRKAPVQDREISMVDNNGYDDGSGPSKRTLFDRDDDIEDDDDGDDGGRAKKHTGFSGFRTASGKSMEETGDLRLKLFGKPNVASTSMANLNQASARFPQMFVPPRHALIRDLSLSERENYFAKILALVEGKLGDGNGDLALRTVVALETWCYARSKNPSTYKTYIGSRMREVAAVGFGDVETGSNKLNIASTILEEERKK